MKIGQSDRWWNLEVPIVKISIVVGAAFAALAVWLVYGDLIGDIAWGISHQHNATFRGLTLRVPWRWREEPWTNYNEFEVSRSNGGLAWRASATVYYQNLAPIEAAKIAQLERNLAAESERKVNALIARGAKTISPQPQSGSHHDVHGDDLIEAHYECVNHGLNWSPILTDTCFSRDGRWRVEIIGYEQNRSDLGMILRGVASMGTPSK